MKKFAFLILLMTIPFPLLAKDSVFSTVSVDLVGGVNLMGGETMSRETATEKDVDRVDGYLAEIWCDYYPFRPKIDREQSMAGRIGIRTTFGTYAAWLSEEDSDGNANEKGPKYIWFKSVMIGPVFKWAPTLRQTDEGLKANVAFIGYLQIGPMWGFMRPYPLDQENGSLPHMRSRITGFRIEEGAGLEYSGGSMVHAGMSCGLCCDYIRMHPNYYSRINRWTTIVELNFKAYAGLSF